MSAMRTFVMTALGVLATTLSAGCSAPPLEEEADGEVLSLDSWAQSFKGAIEPRSLASGPKGDLLVGGKFSASVNFGGGALTAEVPNSVFLAHFDAEGNHLFSGRTGSSDSMDSVAIGPGGDLYAAGSFNNLINFGTEQMSGTNDGYVASFTPGGVSSFSLQIGAEENDMVDDVTTTPSGDVIVSGRTVGNVDLGGGAPNGDMYQQQGFVAAFDASGHYLWEVRIDGGFNSPFVLCSDGDGNVIVGGSSYYASLVFGDEVSDGGTFVAKISAMGEPLWIKGSGASGGSIQAIRDIAVDANGDIVFGGLYYNELSFGDVDLPYASSQNGYLFKLSSSGKVQLGKAFVTESYAFDLQLDVAPEGDVVVAMSAQGAIDFGDGPVVSDGTFDVVLARFTPEGKLVETRRLDGTSGEIALDLAIDPSGKPVLLGAFDGVLDLDGLVTRGETRLVAGIGGSMFLTRLSF